MCGHSQRKIASELIIGYSSGKIASRQELESLYTSHGATHSGYRIRTGRLLQNFFGKDNIARAMMYGVTHIPGILPIIKQTHGNPFRYPLHE